MSATQTRSASESHISTNTLAITQRLQTDLLAVKNLYECLSETSAREFVEDLRVFIEHKAISRVQFIWTHPMWGHVIGAVRYDVVAGSANLLCDRAGGISYDPELKEAPFSVWITFSSAWYGYPATTQQNIVAQLQKSWTPGTLRFGSGSFSGDRTYAGGGDQALHRYVWQRSS